MIKLGKTPLNCEIEVGPQHNRFTYWIREQKSGILALIILLLLVVLSAAEAVPVIGWGGYALCLIGVTVIGAVTEIVQHK